MKSFFPGFIGILFLFFITSCLKEKSFELGGAAKASLTSEVTGYCLPKRVLGSYSVDRALNDSNFIEVEINVTSAGTYTIRTDTINGYSFSAFGALTQTGTNRIKLKGSGKPIAEGTDVFEVQYDSTSCFVQVIVLPAGSTGPAVFTLAGTGGSCMNATVAGSYGKFVSLTSSNKVDIEIDAVSVGTYAITTDQINGYSFSGTGTIGTTGVQTITLFGSGTPRTDGSNTFTVTSGAESCTFTVTVGGVTPPPATPGSHFPLTANSWWSYDDLFVQDTNKVVNAGTAVYNNLTYQMFITSDDSGPYDTSYYRRSGDDYFEYALADVYSSFSFDTDVKGEILILKENLATNATWTSATFTGTLSGQALGIRYVFTCTDANATVDINGKTFTNVYKITLKPQINIMNTGFVDDNIFFTYYYAKDVGAIYKDLVQASTIHHEEKIRNWKVN